MRPRKSAMIVSAALVLGGLASATAPASVPGRPAPYFELPALDGSGRVTSTELFAKHPRTFIVFWSSGCPVCVESLRECQRFYARVSGGDMSVVGINGDRGDDLAARGAVAAAGARFTQLRDRAGAVTAGYGVPAASFAVFLVGGDGMVVSRSIDPEGDIVSLMERMLLGVAVEGRTDEAEPHVRTPRDAPQWGAPTARANESGGIVFRADARTKFLSVDTRGAAARGPFGERLEPGNVFLQRFSLEATARFGPHLSAGGILRAGNEGLDVLRAGPEYFDSEWGSAFALIEAGRASLRLGYFSLHMTPLTMMRWDWDDSPRTGGVSGCDCGGAAGVASGPSREEFGPTLRSLEELGPDLTFEGGLGRYARGEFAADLFYALPRRARDTKAMAWQFGGEERAAYSLEIYGLQARWRRLDRRTGRFWGAGLHLLGHREDPRSIDPIALGYAPFERYEGHILTTTVEIPLAASASLRAEWIPMYLNHHKDAVALCRTTGRNLGPARDERVDLEASGGIAGVVIERTGPFEMRFDYLRLGDEFYSPFAALTYAAGRHGARTAATVHLPGGWSTLSLFYKRMRGLSAPPGGAEKDNLSFAGVTFDFDHPRGPGGGISYFDQGEWRSGEADPFDDSRRTVTVGVRYTFLRQAWIEALYQRNKETGTREDGEGTTSDIYSLALRAEF